MSEQGNRLHSAGARTGLCGAAFLALLVLSSAACGESTTTPPTGSLLVSVKGLPDGVAHSVQVTGPRGFSLTIPSGPGTSESTTLTALHGGTYTITAADVTSGGNRYSAQPATQAVVVRDGGFASARAISYAPASARLELSVLGLPPGAQASVTVSGPDGFVRTLTGTSELGLLAPGSYTVTASNVEAGGKTFRASVTPRQLTLTASTDPSSVVVDYGSGDGALAVTISGLRTETDAAVTVTGPGGYQRTLGASTTLEHLEAGIYTVAASTVASSLTTHVPAPTTETRSVTAGDTSAVSVVYGSEPLVLGLELVAEGLTQPVFLTAPPGDERLFIVERTGHVRIFVDGSMLVTPFVVISGRINSSGESGLLSMAFDPNYATNGFFYLYYVSSGGSLVVERFTSTPGHNVATGGSQVVISIPHGGSTHHGGTIAFGPDGMLYIAPGDGGCCGDPNDLAQNPNSLLGKVLRIDARTLPYTIPPGNPFIDRAPARPEIWATGLRNPWRFSFDPPAGMLYIGDVGQDAREEINVARASAPGLNYGWRNMEGKACFVPSTNCDPGNVFTYPVIDYPHSEGCSVTGGYVYRGSAIPELTGHYLYSDYCRGWLRSFRLLVGTAAEQRQWAGITVPQSTSFGTDGTGELYMIGGTQVWRIVRQ